MGRVHRERGLAEAGRAVHHGDAYRTRAARRVFAHQQLAQVSDVSLPAGEVPDVGRKLRGAGGMTCSPDPGPGSGAPGPAGAATPAELGSAMEPIAIEPGESARDDAATPPASSSVPGPAPAV